MLTLRKWYLDVVDERGNAAIVYWARLGWSSLAVHQASTLVTLDGAVFDRSVPRIREAPRFEGEEIRWRCDALRVDGCWRRRCPGHERELLRRGRRAVLWSCAMPRAECTLSVGDCVINGLGYAEELTMTIAPWRLPIDELRWGRALADDVGVVWIDWTGPRPLRLVLLDGKPVQTQPGDLLDDRAVSWPGGRLELAPRQTLRDAPIAEGALADSASIVRLAPHRILSAHETKWLSSAVLHVGSEPPRPALAIHEVVRFARKPR